ncbi:MAG TPA: alkaline phosphatase family protein [Rhizomicrobium sp.]|jgi:arylsulfatase A-like enzyme|nr:alkaline phosphatase family protein [Rhizomicrobium sp.]
MKTVALAAALVLAALPAAAKPAAHAPRNVIIFVADGLRYSSVTPDLAPTFASVRQAGVDFTNSHSIYPTVTTANASAIATGHYLGDTGDYGNTLWFAYPVQAQGGTPLTFLEHDNVLRDVKAHFGDGYMGETSLLAAARTAGMATAVVGKFGPAAIQDIGAMNGDGIIVDDGANIPLGPDGRATGFVKIGDDLAKRIAAAGLPDKAPPSAVPNTTQQTYITDLTTKAMLPLLKDRGGKKGFALLYWCRDPDATQHSQEDSVGALIPGINGPTAHAGIADADAQLKRLLDTLRALGLDKTTDVFVTADHGFSTISHSLPTDDGAILPASLPQGFVAVDIAHVLGQPLFDPDADGAEILFAENGQHPSRGSALIGPTADAPQAIVAANGGSDLIYTPGPDGTKTAKAIYAMLLNAPYTGALFVNDALLKADPAAFAGALPMSAVNLLGAATVPNPSIVIGFRSWVAKDCTLGDQLCAVEIADTNLHTGQGMHGSISRADTRNFMAAIGPDFRRGFADPTPVSNADINPTLAHILRLRIAPHGTLTGRPATEALAGGKPVPFKAVVQQATPAANGQRTVLEYQEAAGRHYFDAAGFPGRAVGLMAK